MKKVRVSRDLVFKVKASFAVVLLALIAACSSELTPVDDEFILITPLEGSWEAVDSNEELSFAVDNLGGSEFPLVYSFAEGFIDSPLDTCGVASGGSDAITDGSITIEGEFDNGRITAFLAGTNREVICFTGKFADLRKLVLDPIRELPLREYANERVDVAMERGIWIGGGENPVRLLFTEPNSVDNGSSDFESSVEVFGCDVSDTENSIAFEGTMLGFNVTTLSNPGIDTLSATSSGLSLYTDIEFVDRDTLQVVDASGDSHRLKRSNNVANEPCDA